MKSEHANKVKVHKYSYTYITHTISLIDFSAIMHELSMCRVPEFRTFSLKLKPAVNFRN